MPGPWIGLSPYPSSLSALDVLLGPIAVLVVFAVLWLALSLLWKVMAETVVVLTAVLTFLFTLPFDPILLCASVVGFLPGYLLSRRRPIPGVDMLDEVFGPMPQDDVGFCLWAEHVARMSGSRWFQRFLEDPDVRLDCTLHWPFVLMTVSMFRHAVGWALVAAVCFQFFYSVAYYGMPAAVGAIVVGWVAFMTGMQFGLLMRRRRGLKRLRAMRAAR